MSEKISWSLTAGSSSAPGISATGAAASDATFSTSVKLSKKSNARVLALQVNDMDKVVVLAISCDLLDGKVTVKATGEATPLTGPLLLFGEAAKLFAKDLKTLTVQNRSDAQVANLSVLIGLSL